MEQTSVSDTPLRRLRIQRGLSLDEVARGVGIHNSQLSRIERGGDTTKKTAQAIADFFGGEISALEIIFPEHVALAAESPGPGSASAPTARAAPTARRATGSRHGRR